MDTHPTLALDARSCTGLERDPWQAAPAPRLLALNADSAGHLVPRTAVRGTVHSVFDRAGNFAVGELLLTLCLPGAARGPTTLRLAQHPPRPLRELLDVGEPVWCDEAFLCTPRLRVSLRQTPLWRPSLPARRPRAERLAERLPLAATALARHREGGLNVLDREAAAPLAALREACRVLDEGQAREHATRLIGWGEGLTPAGDDALAGLLAGLDAMAGEHAARLRFRAALATHVVASSVRTTAIAAHGLRMACAGYHGEPLCRLCDALLDERHRDSVPAALDAMFAIGATSGADMTSGLLAGLDAWSTAPSARH
jgi:hypothetical protein